MIDFIQYRERLKEIKDKKKQYDSFMKKTIILTLREIIVHLRNELDHLCDDTGMLEVTGEVSDYNHIFSLRYNYHDVEYDYPKKFVVISFVYYPGGDIDVQFNLYSTNMYRGDMGDEFMNKVRAYFIENNLLSYIGKKINGITPMLDDMKFKKNHSQDIIWREVRKEMADMVNNLIETLLRGETIELTQPKLFTHGNKKFLGGKIFYERKEGKASGALVITNTVSNRTQEWGSFSMNSLTKTCREIANHEREILS